MKKNKFENFLIGVYVIVEAILLVIIKKTEQQGHIGIDIDNIFMFLAILVNTIVVLFYYFKYGIKRKEKHENLVILALVLNLFADLFLSLLDTDETMLPGFAFFCTLEAVYAWYLKSSRSSIITRVVLFSVGCVLSYYAGLLSLVNAFGILNLSIVLINVVDAWKSKNMNPGLMFKLGITLFCAGDYCILLRTVTEGFTHDIFAFLVWVTYIPTQMLIVLNYIKRLHSDKEQRLNT